MIFNTPQLNMKTIDLLNSLQGREKKEFEAVIKMHKRNSLKNLYFFLKKTTQQDRRTSKGKTFQGSIFQKIRVFKGLFDSQ